MPQCGWPLGSLASWGKTWLRALTRCTHCACVGAPAPLPQGALRYNLTWSTEGSSANIATPANGRCAHHGARTGSFGVPFALDGVEYGAFNTSGGLGTLTETLAGKARQVDYQSIRYPGHCAILKLLLNDLRLRDRRDLLKTCWKPPSPPPTRT